MQPLDAIANIFQLPEMRVELNLWRVLAREALNCVAYVLLPDAREITRLCPKGESFAARFSSCAPPTPFLSSTAGTLV